MTVKYWFRPTVLPILPPGSPDTGFSHFRITSGFGMRVNPLNPTGPKVFHGGWDLGNYRPGDKVCSVAAGLVIAEGVLGPPWSAPAPPNSGWFGNYGGIMAVVRHDEDTVSIYAHMRSTRVSAGDHVQAGDILGEVGDTGSAKGQPHLHHGVQIKGQDVDPATLDYQMEGDVATYKDVPPNHRFYEEIEYCNRHNLIYGITLPDGTRMFYPDSPVTRGQLAAVTMRMHKQTDEE